MSGCESAGSRMARPVARAGKDQVAVIRRGESCMAVELTIEPYS